MSDQASDGGSGASRDGGSGGTPTRPRLRDFWTDLPREGKFLLSTIIIDFIGTGLAMPFLVVYLTLVPYIPTAGEMKTKPTQHSVKELREIGIQPDIVLCRAERSANTVSLVKRR